MINYHDVIVYETFPFTLKRKAGVFKFLCLEERFQKAPFSCRIRVDDSGPKSRNKTEFSKSSGVVCICGLS